MLRERWGVGYIRIILGGYIGIMENKTETMIIGFI